LETFSTFWANNIRKTAERATGPLGKLVLTSGVWQRLEQGDPDDQISVKEQTKKRQLDSWNDYT